MIRIISEANPVVREQLAILTALIDARFKTVRRATERVEPFAGLAGFGIKEPESFPRQELEVLQFIDWRFSDRASWDASQQATEANVHEICIKLLDSAARDATAITDGPLLFWRVLPTFIFEPDFERRETTVGLIARAYVLNEGKTMKEFTLKVTYSDDAEINPPDEVIKIKDALGEKCVSVVMELYEEPIQ